MRSSPLAHFWKEKASERRLVYGGTSRNQPASTKALKTVSSGMRGLQRQ